MGRRGEGVARLKDRWATMTGRLLLLLVLAWSAVFTVVAGFQVEDGCVVRDGLEVQMEGMLLTFTVREPLDPGLSMTLQRPGQEPIPLSFPLSATPNTQQGVRWSVAALSLYPDLELTFGGRRVLKMDNVTFNAPPKLVIKNAKIMTNCPNEGRPIHALSKARQSVNVPLANGDEVSILGLFNTHIKVHLKLDSKFPLAWDGNNVNMKNSVSKNTYNSRRPLTLKFTLSDKSYEITWNGQSERKENWINGTMKKLEVSITPSSNNSDFTLFVAATSPAPTLAPIPPPTPEYSSGVSSVVMLLTASLVVTISLLSVTAAIILCRRHQRGCDFVDKKEDEKTTCVAKESEDQEEEEEEAPARPPRPAHHGFEEREATPATPRPNKQQQQGVELASAHPPLYNPYQYEGEDGGETVTGHPPIYNHYQYEQQQYHEEQQQYHEEEQQQQQPWTETLPPTKEEPDYIMAEQVKPFIVEMLKKENVFSGDINYHDEASRSVSAQPLNEPRYVTRQYSDGSSNYGESYQQGYPEQGEAGYGHPSGQSIRENNYEEDYMVLFPQQRQEAFHGPPK